MKREDKKVITVHVKTRCKKEGVDQLKENEFTVRVKTPPVDGRANKRVVELLSKHLGRPKTSFHLFRGEKAKIKMFSLS